MKVATAVIGARAAAAVAPADAVKTGVPADVPKDLLWWGPQRVGPVVLTLHGPAQVIFIVLSLIAWVMLLVEVFKEEHKHMFRWATAVGCVVVSGYLFWIVKGLYVLKWLRGEVANYKRLSVELRGRLEELQKRNTEYEKLNKEQVHANAELDLEVRQLAEHVADCQQQNAVRDKVNNEMAQRVQDLRITERRLHTLAEHCSGSVGQAKSVIETLERNIQLDTVSSVMLFFARSDSNTNGRIDPDELGLFIDNLRILCGHFPGIDKESIKASIMEKGVVETEHIRELVDAMFANLGKGDAVCGNSNS